jgi:hypothetical protein
VAAASFLSDFQGKIGGLPSIVYRAVQSPMTSLGPTWARLLACGRERDMRSTVAGITRSYGVLDLIVHWAVQNRRPAMAAIGLVVLGGLLWAVDLFPPRWPDPSICLPAPIGSSEIESDSPGMPGPKFGITKTVSSTVVEMPCSGPGQKYGVR